MAKHYTLTCDRCGLVKENNHSGDWFDSSTAVILPGAPEWGFLKCGRVCQPRHYDLCPKCLNEAESYLVDTAKILPEKEES